MPKYNKRCRKCNHALLVPTWKLCQSCTTKQKTEQIIKAKLIEQKYICRPEKGLIHIPDEADILLYDERYKIIGYRLPSEFV